MCGHDFLERPDTERYFSGFIACNVIGFANEFQFSKIAFINYCFLLLAFMILYPNIIEIFS
jgi:hypothetical protein